MSAVSQTQFSPNNKVTLLESVHGLHFLPGNKTLQAEDIPREADTASILMRPVGFLGQLCWLTASCCRAQCVRDCTQTNTCDKSVPPDALEFCQPTLVSFLQQEPLRANVSPTSPLAVHVSCSTSTGRGFRFPGASSLSPVTKTSSQVCHWACSKVMVPVFTTCWPNNCLQRTTLKMRQYNSNKSLKY